MCHSNNTVTFIKLSQKTTNKRVSDSSTSLGPTVFREPRNFEPSRGIWPLPRNYRVFTEFHRIPRKHRNSEATAKFRKSVLLL